MVTIVSGSSLGLQTSLQNTRTNVGGNVQGQDPDQIYVNSATGNLVVQDTDEVLSSVGSGLSIVRTYNSQGSIDTPSGANWSLSVDEQILGLTGTVNTSGSTITKQFGDGAQIVYTYNTTLGLYTAALGQGAEDTLSYNASTAQWTWTDGSTQDTETYNSAGQLLRSTDTSGNVTTFTYTGSLLTQISDPSGQITYLDYTGNNLTDIREVSNGVTQKRVTYTYDSLNRLTSVAVDLTPANDSSSDPTYVTTYTYVSEPTPSMAPTDLLASITQSDGTKVSFSYGIYGGSYRIAQITDGNGNVTTFNDSGWNGDVVTQPVYDGANSSVLSGYGGYYTVQSGDTWASIVKTVYWGETSAAAIASLQAFMGNPTLTAGTKLYVPMVLEYISKESLLTSTTVTDALGNVTTYTNQANTGLLTSVVTPTTHTNYTYDTSGDLLTATQDPTGLDETTTYTYNSNGDVLSSVDPDGNTITYTYNGANQLLTETQYLMPASGSTAASSPLTSYYVYDADNRLNYEISADGDVTEYIYNSQGERTSQIVYQGAEYNVSGVSASSPPTLSQMTTWAAAQNLTEIERTDYTYDFRGNLSTSTVYGATSSTGAGVTSTASVTQYVYDQRGLLLQVIDPRGSANAANAGNASLPYATTYTYDGLGRVLTETQWVSSGVTETTSYQYTASGDTITATAANGLVTTSVYNADGELVSEASSSSGQSLGTTTYTYDADGLLRTVTNPDGIQTHTLYDASGREVATVDGDGTLTEYVYNTVGEIVETIVYAGTVNTASLADVNGKPANVSLATLVSEANTNPSANQITRSVYNAAGQLVYSIDAAGAVTQSLYDGLGRVIETIAYATTVSIPASDGALTPAQVPVVSSSNDRTTRNFYDSDGNLIGTLDAAGYLTTYQYNAAGELVEETQFATATTASLRASGTLAQLTPASAPTQDIVSHYFYDGEGREVGVIDGDGYLTQTEYDAAGNILETIRYSTPVTYTAGATLASLIPTTLGNSEITQYQYDGEDRLVQETNYQGTVTQYQYDAVGNLISTTVAAGTADARTTETRYNALGQVIGQLTAEGAALITGSLTQAQINAIWAQYGVSYTYDAAGLRTSMTDENGNTTYYYYDDDGRLQYSVNAAGDVTESVYDAFGRLTDQIAYDTTIATSGLTGGLTASSTIASLVGAIANSAIDSSTTTTYGVDATGRTEITSTAQGDSVSEQFDAFGDVLSSIQSVSSTQSVTTDYAYDARGLLLKTTTDPTGLDVVTSDAYDAFGRLIQSTDGNGNVTTYAYDQLGRQVQTTDALGGTTRTTYDAFARVLTTTDALGNITTYSYNDTARSMTVTNPDGVAVTTVDNEFGQEVQVTDGNGNVTTYTYDLNGDLTGTSEAGVVSSATYDAAGLLLTSTDADGIVTAYTYDAANRVLTKTLDPTTSDPNGLALVTRYGYDAEGRTVSTTNTQGVVTTSAYDRDGRVTQVVVDPYNATTNPNGLNLTTTYTYNDEGDVLTVTQGAGSSNPQVTQYTYDTLGRRTQTVIDPGTGTNPATGEAYLNLTTKYFYDADGNLVHTINADNDSTWYVYDADDELHYTVNALGGITETDYDADGRVIETKEYATAMTPPASTVNQLTAAQVAPVASSADRIDRNFYDAAGEEVYSIDAAGTVTQSTYDGDGNVIQLRVIGGVELTGTYANTAAVTAALGTAATTLGAQDRVQWTVYNAFNRAIYTIDALGNVTQTQYDGDGNVIASTEYATPVTAPTGLVSKLSANTTTNVITATYAGGGTATLTVTANAATDRTIRYWYDTAGRQVFELSAAGYLTETQYNDAARTQTVTVYAAKQTFSGSVTTSQLEGSSSPIVKSTGSPVSVPSEALGATTSTSTNVVVGKDETTTTYYDTAGRVSKVVNALSGTESYTYDALGDKTSYTNEAGETWTYKYDADGRLIEEVTPQVSVSTVTSSSGSLTSTPAMTAIATLMTYDGMGNVLTLTEGVEVASGGTLNYAGSRVTSYGYDALGRQVLVTLPAVPTYNGIASDNVDAIGSSVGSNSTLQSPTTQVVYDTLGDEIASKDASGNWTYKVYDQLGRVTYEIDALDYVTGYTYDAFGNQLTTTRYANALSGSITGATLSSLQLTSGGGSDEPATITVKNGSGSTTVEVTTSSQDRTVTSTYDRDNRVQSVSQPSVYAYVPGAATPTFTAAPTTFYAYNAFGQVVSTATLTNPDGTPITNPYVNPNANTWNYTYSYYDQDGNEVADVDADGYLTTYQYDAFGNLTAEDEYATAVSGSTIAKAGTATAAATDRQTLYQYDQLNRQISQALVGVQYATMTGSAGALTANAGSGTAYTYYGYDALGNQTSVTTVSNGTVATTYTYYDVLGRVIATVGPTSTEGVGGSTVTPLTILQRDVYGNLVAETQYAAGLTSTTGLGGSPVPGVAPTAANNINTTANTAEDRTTIYLRDVEGHALETDQKLSTGESEQYDAYNAVGELVKQYQAANTTGDTLVTFYVYDALGRLTDTIQPELLSASNPGTDEVSDQYSEYDAFGEVIAQGTGAYGQAKVYQEFSYYDANGRVYLTNSGTGAYTAYLYDLSGNATGKLQDQATSGGTSYDLSTLSSQGSAASAYAAYAGNTGSLMFTQTRYDAMGNVVEQLEPTYSSASPEEEIDNTSVQVQTLGGTAYLTWDAPADSTLTPALTINGNAASFTKLPPVTGSEYGYEAEYAITGAGLPNGTNTYTITYTRPDGSVAGVATGSFTVGQSLSISTTNPGTVSGVAAAMSGSNLTVSWTPDNTSVTPTFSLLVGSTWQSYSGSINESGVASVTFTAPAVGSYQYRVSDALNGETEAQGTGTLTVNASTTTTTLGITGGTTGTVNSVTGSVSGSTASVSWVPNSGVTSATFAILIGSTWTTYNATLTESSASVSFTLPAAGSYQYRITDLVNGETQAQGTGSISFTAASSSTSVSASPATTGTVSSLSTSVTATETPIYNESGQITGYTVTGSTVKVNWVAASGVTSSTFAILIGSTWTTYTASLTESGACAVSFAMPSAGTYQYRITDVLSNGAIQAQATGTMTFSGWNSSTAGTATIPSETQLEAVSGFENLGGGNFGWTTAPNSGDTIKFYYLGSSWTQLTVSGSNPYYVNLSALSGTYSYEVEYFASGAVAPYRVGTGTVTVSTTTTPASTSVGTPTQLQSVGGLEDLGNSVFGWTTAENSGDTITFHYKAAGATSWAGTLTVSGSGSGPFSVNLSGLSGTIDYEIDYTASGASAPYRVGTGVVAINRTTSPETASASTATNLSSVGGFTDLGNGVLGWTTAENSGDTITVHYKAAGATSWAGTLPVTQVTSGGVTYYSVNLHSLSGTIDYEVDYTASGAAQPYRVETGAVTVNTGVSAVTDTTASTIAHQATTVTPSESQTVDRWGNVTSVTNTAGETTSYLYNRYNQVIETLDPKVTAVSVAVTSTTNLSALGTVSSTTETPTSYNYYDIYGNLIGTKDADGNINGKTYNAANQLISQQDADGGEIFYVYDAFGDQIEVETQVSTTGSSTLAYITRNAYDQAGRLIDTEQELTAGTFAASDAAGKSADTGFASSLLLGTNANVILTQYVYDLAGRRTETIDGANETSTTTYDLHGNVIATTTPPNAVGATETTRYGYDLENQKVSETDPDENTQSWTYDYFNNLLSQVDMGGTTYTYNYDPRSKLLISMSSSGGQFGGEAKTYSYDTANYLTEINDTGVDSITLYEYDQAGRIEREQTYDGGLLTEDTSTQYDAMGRISNLSGLGYSVSYTYDAAGNRTNILADYSTAVGSVSTQNYWYGYDKMNRVLISEGANSSSTTTSGTISVNSSQGTLLSYDWRGDRTSATTEGTVITVSGSTYSDPTEMGYYSYNYDGAGRLTATAVQPQGASSSPIVLEARIYDKASRIIQDTTQAVPSGGSSLSSTVETNDYNPDGSLNYSETTLNGAMQSMVYYTYDTTDESGNVTEHSYYDAAGNLTGYEVAFDDSSGKLAYESFDTYTYKLGTSYLEASQSVTSTAENDPAPGPGETEYTYNADQQLIQYTNTQQTSSNRYFLNDAQGQVLTVVQGNDGNYGSTTTYGSDSAAQTAFTNALMSGPAFFQSEANAQYFFFDSQGNSTGTYGEIDGAMTANFDENFTPISEQYPAQQPPQYVVESGDTLATIAMRAYGDASLWYIIAQANGLTEDGPGTALTTGTALTLPNIVADRSNTSQTFKPFEVSEALGNTTPTQPNPPAPAASGGGGCGVIGEILVAVVAIVATIYTAGVASEALAGTLGSSGALGGGAFSAGLGALSGSTAAVGTTIGTDIAASTLGGAVGDAASQGVGIATGEQSSFNWAGVAAGAAGAALGAGLGSVASNGGLAAEMDITNTTLQEVANGAIDATLNQGINSALGLQSGFNWDAVAAAAIAAPIAGKVAPVIGKSVAADFESEAGKLAAQLTGAVVNQITYAAFAGGKINYVSLSADDFGNAIGDSIVQADAGPQYGLTNEQQQQEYSDINASTNAAVAADGDQIPAQIATAAGLQLSNPEIQLQNINVEVNSRDVAQAQGGSSSETTDALTKNLSPLAASQLEDIQVDPDLIQLPPITVSTQEGGSNVPMDSSSPVAVEAPASTTASPLRDIANQLDVQIPASGPAAADPTQNMDDNEAAAYSEALSQRPGNAGGAMDAALGAGIAEKISELRAAIQDDPDLDPDGSLTNQLNVATDALLAKDAYYPNGIPQLLPDGVTRLMTNSDLAPLNITANMLQPSDGSGFMAAAYIDTNRGTDPTYIIADKGTATGADWKNDAEQGLGLPAQQYADADLIADKVALSSEADAVEYTGHSLGGGLASLQALVGDAPAVTFNAAGLSPITELRYHVFLNSLFSPPSIQAYYVDGEPLSTLQDDSGLPSAIGNRIPLPADLPVQMTTDGLIDSEPMTLLQTLKNSANGNLHFMGSVESSIYDNFPVFKLVPP